MDSKLESQDNPPATNQPPGYQPSPGRKLFMLGLCVVGLIVIWVFYFLSK